MRPSPGLRHRCFRGRFVVSALLAVLLLLLPVSGWARRGGRVSVGGSSTFAPPVSGGFPSRVQSWGNSSPVTVSPRMGSRGSSSAAAGAYGVDQAVINRARTQGTLFQSRGDAIRAFERDNANKFPSSFPREPSARPDYIPSTTTVDGRDYDVTYDPRHGGYGYTRDGAWVAYSALRDASVLSMLMRRGGYLYPGVGMAGAGGGAVGGSASWFSGPGSGLLILLLIVGLWAMIPRRRGTAQYYRGAPAPYTPRSAGWRPPDAPPPARGSSERRKPMDSSFDTHSAALWRSLRPGSTVVLKDEQTLADMISSGESLTSGRDYNVLEAWRIQEAHGIAEWQFFRIRSPHDEDATWLLIKSAGDELGAGVYFEADGFVPGNREDLLSRQMYWVFGEPPDPNNYRLQDLVFAPRLTFNVDVNGTSSQAVFDKAGNLEFHGKASADPAPTDLSFAQSTEMIASVAEYRTVVPTPNPKMIFFEVGLPNPAGGLIRMLQGADISIADIEVLPLDDGVTGGRWVN